MRSRILLRVRSNSLSSLSLKQTLTDRSSTTFERQNIYDTKSKRIEYEEWIVAEFLLQGDELGMPLFDQSDYLARFEIRDRH